MLVWTRIRWIIDAHDSRSILELSHEGKKISIFRLDTLVHFKECPKASLYILQTTYTCAIVNVEKSNSRYTHMMCVSTQTAYYMLLEAVICWCW
jgi:hypothetical protein